MKKALLLALLLLLPPLAGCQAARYAHKLATHRVVKVPTENMTPTIKPGDMALVDERYYDSRPVERFDMVMFTSPEMNDLTGEQGAVYIKRVIALGGETVEIRGGRLYVNGQELAQPFSFVPHEPDEELTPVSVPPGEYFLLGDNRRNSLDSRYWKRPSVAKSLVRGKVVEILPQ